MGNTERGDLGRDRNQERKKRKEEEKKRGRRRGGDERREKRMKMFTCKYPASSCYHKPTVRNPT